jgi:hypothetical protein
MRRQSRNISKHVGTDACSTTIAVASAFTVGSLAVRGLFFALVRRLLIQVSARPLSNER